MDRHRTAHVVMNLEPGEAKAHVPAHVDVLAGAARPATRIDGGRIDQLVAGAAGAFRATAVFHAQRSFGRVGSRSTNYNDLEESLGLSRSYRLQLADPAAALTTVRRLREAHGVESAALETLASAPAAVAMAPPPSQRDIEEPHNRVKAPEALAIEEGDERVTVAVVDTGVSLGHSELQRKLLSGYDAVELGLGRISSTTTLVGDSHGRDFSPADDVGHGSHVAGIIGAQGWQLPKGAGGRSLLLPIRVLAGAQTIGGTDVTGVGALGDIDAGLKVAVDLGAKVINMSFGTPSSALDEHAPPPHQRVIEYASEHGCILVAASGNSGRSEDFYPAAAPGVITVGSVDAENRRSTFSTYGEHVDVSAPGEEIMSVGRRGYRRSTGTSHAAPFVAGAAALLAARARRHGRDLSGEQAREILVASAAASSSDRSEVGAGVLDIAEAIRTLDNELAHNDQQQQGATHG